MVYVAYASHGDSGLFHGWILVYNAATLEQVTAYNDTPNGAEGGIWQGGGGPASDSNGNIFVETGNGSFDGDGDGDDFGDSVLKLQLAGSAEGADSLLLLADWYTPFNQELFASSDLDLGSGGPLLLPDQTTSPAHLLVSGDKQGNIYLLDRDNLGHFVADKKSQGVQYLPRAIYSILGTPAYWRGLVYFWGEGNALRAYRLRNGRLSKSPVSRGPAILAGVASPTVSANGASGGIVWLQEWGIRKRDNTPQQPAILDAYDATNVSRELYRSNRRRDAAGNAVKFTVPTVADGRVYVGGQYQLTVYGLLP